MILDPRTLDELARKLASAMPAGLSAVQHDIEKNLRATLEGVLRRLDLVTREEFDVQTALLERCREQLGALETRVQELEKASAQPQSTGPGSQRP